MKKAILTLTVLSVLAVWGGVSVFAGQNGNAAPAQETPATAAKKTTHHHHAHHAASPNLTAKYAKGTQELSGNISIVDAGQKVVVVTDSNGVPFDLKVTRGTRIEVNGQKSTLDALSNQTDKQATVKYRDGLDRGLIAESIQVSG
ncbi:MAG: hypothetical protein ACRD1N_10360 [Terriglobia bacterium]